jgi:hypothetical protein
MEHMTDSKDAAGSDESAGTMTRASDVSCETTEQPDLTVNAVDGMEYPEAVGFDSMPDDPRLEQAFALIRAAVADAGENAVKAFISGLQSQPVSKNAAPPTTRINRHPQAEKFTRAPAGSARVLCKRVLSEAGDRGLTTTKIRDKADGDYERMLSVSAIRNELTVGSNLTPPLYKQVGGVWYLSAHAPSTMRIVS